LTTPDTHIFMEPYRMGHQVLLTYQFIIQFDRQIPDSRAMQKFLRSILFATGTKTVGFRIIFIQIEIHFVPGNRKEIKERLFHLLMNTEKAVTIAIQ